MINSFKNRATIGVLSLFLIFGQTQEGFGRNDNRYEGFLQRQERIEQELIEQGRLEHERVQREIIEEDRIAQERIAQERIAQERIAQERIAQERKRVLLRERVLLRLSGEYARKNIKDFFFLFLMMCASDVLYRIWPPKPWYVSTACDPDYIGPREYAEIPCVGPKKDSENHTSYEGLYAEVNREEYQTMGDSAFGMNEEEGEEFVQGATFETVDSLNEPVMYEPEGASRKKFLDLRV